MFYSSADDAWYCPDHETITQQQLAVDEGMAESTSEAKSKIKLWRARFGAYRGFYNASKKLFKLMLDDDDILTDEWRVMTRAERRHVQRMAVKQAKKGNRALQRAQQGETDEQPAATGEVAQEQP
jgi:hypothetical protein